MIRTNDVENAIEECRRFEKRAVEWLRNERKNEHGRNSSSKLFRASLDVSDVLIKLRGRRDK